MLARRVLVGGIGSGIVNPGPPPEEPSLPVASVLTSNPNGGNSPWTIPGALYHATPDKTFITYVDRTGNIEGIEYDHATDTVGGPYTIHANFHVDAHDSPAIVRRASDGKFICVYSVHNSTPINLRVSTNADSLNGWGSATNLDGQLGGSRYTDYQLYELNGTLYMLYRDEPVAGTDSRWMLSTNDAATPTAGWTAQANQFRVNSQRSYVITAMDYANERLHFIATNGSLTSGGTTGFSKLGHFYLDIGANTYHKSDRTQIFSPPFTYTELTEIYSGTGGVFALNLTIDSAGHPVIAATDIIAGDSRYIYIRFDGSDWNATNVSSGDPGYIYGGGGAPQAWGAAVDDGDPNLLWTIEDGGGGQPEVFLHETANGGATFSSTQVTDGTTQLQAQVICIRNPHTDLRVFWQRGAWTHYTNYNVGLVGAGIS
jgi:hypothetical protein